MILKRNAILATVL